jgi:MFS transporter, DHA1 family, multidrug resistance protein
MVFSAQALTMGIMAPIWGALSDRIGRKLMLERALFGGAVILVLMGFARSAEELTLLRAIQGMITGTITASNALVAASAPRDKAGRALGLMQTAAWAGMAIGPLLGGLIADVAGFRMTFYVTAALTLVSGITVHLWVVEDREALKLGASRHKASMLGAWKRILTATGMRVLYTVNFAVRLGATVILPIAPLFVASLLPAGARVATVTGLFTAVTAAAGTLSAIFFGALGDRIGYRRVLIFGCVMSGIAYMLFLGVSEVWQLILLAAVVGVASGAIIPNIGALLAHASPEGDQGTVYGIDASVNSAARTVSPLVGTAVATWFTLQASFAVAGVIFLISALVALAMMPGVGAPQRAGNAMGAAD